MARIRTIKPEFFTSEDIVSLSPLARLLYIGLWCEADREGRMAWKPKTFKMRYLPADGCDIDALCDEILQSGMVRLYGDGYAVIPAFHAHQHINPREAASQLPEPDYTARKTTRKPRDIDASTTRKPRDSDAQGGRERKGKEGDISAEPQSDSTPVVFLPLVSGEDHPVSAEEVAEWGKAYPAVDVGQQLLRMRAWCVANPANRKTARGINAFIVKWLTKAQDTSPRKVGGAKGDDEADRPQWALDAGFPNRYEAENAMCWQHNAHQFRDGKRIGEVAA